MVKIVSLVWSARDKLRNLRLGCNGLFLFFIICAGLVYVTHILKTTHGSPNAVISRYRRSKAHNHTVEEILHFPSNYHVKGVLSLPYGDIVEPFEAWYSPAHKMSRIDYYNGMDKTYQREDLGGHGYACKIVPEFSEKKHKTFTGCLHRRGTRKFPIKAQSIVPSLSYFKYGGDVEFQGSVCAKWVHSFTVYNKQNTYNLYTTKTRPLRPLRYEMMGYDTLLSSYYDHYILDYHEFESWKFDYKTFHIPTDLNCFNFVDDKLQGGFGEINPMMEFMPHSTTGAPYSLSHASTEVKNYPPTYPTPTEDPLKYLLEQLSKMPTIEKQETSPRDAARQTFPAKNFPPRARARSSPAGSVEHKAKPMRHYEDLVNILFGLFKVDYKRKYFSMREHEKRKDIYRHNLRFVKSRNRQHLGYKLKLNHMADMTEKEFQKNKGLLKERGAHAIHGGLKFELSGGDKEKKLPGTVDWKKSGAVNPVKSQGICGSCYAYAVTGAMEGAYFRKTGKLLDLSEQQIIDCTWGFGNRGCKGGYPYRAMQWIMKHKGLATDASYGKYLAQEGYCHFKNATNGASLETYMSITRGNCTELKMGLAFYGPVSILINTQPKSFKFYGSGIYHDPKCNHAFDHAALAVGYGEENGVPYWLVKNSWSKAWGNEGYIKIAQKDDNCGVTQKAVVVKVTV